MEYNNNLPDWGNEGTEPSEHRIETGFETGYKPPAGIFNWFWSKVIKAIKELQEKFGSHAENKGNPHGVTAEQVGLDKVNNTADSEKSVKFASEAGVGKKVENALLIRFNGGNTEGTDKWTYDGSTSRSVNVTPDKIGAAEKEHNHEATNINGLRKEIDRIVVATSTDGVTYTATVDGVTELYNGMEITIIPNMKSTSRTVTLNVNGLGAVNVRQPLSFSTFVATAPDRDYFLYENTPCRLMYHANYTSGGIWLMADKQKTSAQDLYGTVPITGGGTGATSASEIKTNLGFLSVKVQNVYHNNMFIPSDGAVTVSIPSYPSNKNFADIFGISVFCNNADGVGGVLNGFKYYYYSDQSQTTPYIDISGVDLSGNMFNGQVVLNADYTLKIRIYRFNVGTGRATSFFKDDGGWLNGITVYFA